MRCDVGLARLSADRRAGLWSVALCCGWLVTLLPALPAQAADPVLVGQWPGWQRGDANGVAVSGNYVYVTIGKAGLAVIDVSNPANPQRVGGCDTSGSACGVAVSGNYAYVADDEAGLQVIDVSNPANPQRVGGYDTSGYARGVAVSGHYAYVADDEAGLQVIDVSNPANPQRVGGYDTSGYAWGVAVSGHYAYVADGDWGLMVFQLAPETNVPPQITQEPQSRTNLAGTTATFTVTASGTAPLSYQWIKNSTNYLTSAGNVSGATTETLTLANVQPADAGRYQVVITNAYGVATSAVATLPMVAGVPRVTSVRLDGANLVYGGVGGIEGGTYYVLATTNVALPVADWVRVATNRFGAGGTFSVTNAVDPAKRQQFFRLQVP